MLTFKDYSDLQNIHNDCIKAAAIMKENNITEAQLNEFLGSLAAGAAGAAAAHYVPKAIQWWNNLTADPDVDRIKKMVVDLANKQGKASGFGTNYKPAMKLIMQGLNQLGSGMKTAQNPSGMTPREKYQALRGTTSTDNSPGSMLQQGAQGVTPTTTSATPAPTGSYAAAKDFFAGKTPGNTEFGVAPPENISSRAPLPSYPGRPRRK